MESNNNKSSGASSGGDGSKFARSLMLLMEDLASIVAFCFKQLCDQLKQFFPQASLRCLEEGQCGGSATRRPRAMRARPRGAVHSGIRCDGCHALPVVGIRHVSKHDCCLLRVMRTTCGSFELRSLLMLV